MNPSAPEPSTLGARIGLCGVLAAYAVILIILIGAVPGGSDNSGYFNEARLLSHGTIHAPMRTLGAVPAREMPYLYTPLGMKPARGRDGVLVPTYPPGLPLLLVPAARAIGWEHAGDLVLILQSLAGIALAIMAGIALIVGGAHPALVLGAVLVWGGLALPPRA